MHAQLSTVELNALYNAIGKAVWHLQYTEGALQTFLTVKIDIQKPGVVSQEQADTLHAKHQRATLGTSLGIAEKHSALDQTLLQRIRILKEERDWLVHRAVRERGEHFNSPEEQARILERLGAFAIEAISLQFAISQELELYLRGCGMDTARILEQARQRNEPH
jgi:hypothetical protein